MPPRKLINLQRNKNMLAGKARKKLLFLSDKENKSQNQTDAERKVNEQNETNQECSAPDYIQQIDASEADASFFVSWNRFDQIGLHSSETFKTIEMEEIDPRYVPECLIESDMHTKLPATMPPGVRMLQMDEENVVQFVPSINPDRDVWQFVCALWSKRNESEPFQTTMGVTQSGDPLSWAIHAEYTAECFLENPTNRITQCRSVLRCVSENLRLTGAFPLNIFIKERGRGRLVQNTVKGLVRPNMDWHFHNDPPDYAHCLRVVEIDNMSYSKYRRCQ